MKDGRCSWCAEWLKVYDDENLGPHFCGTGCDFLWHYEIKRKKQKAENMSEEVEMKIEGIIAAKDAWLASKEATIKEIIRLIRSKSASPNVDSSVVISIDNKNAEKYITTFFQGFGYQVSKSDKDKFMTISWDGVE